MQIRSEEKQILEALAGGAELVQPSTRRVQGQSRWALSWPGREVLRQRGYLLKSHGSYKLSRLGEHVLDESGERW